MDKIKIPIQLAIGGLSKERYIKKIMSKEQVLQQCNKYLKKHYNKTALIPTQSTAQAIKLIINDKDYAAAVISSPAALKNNGLIVYKEDISDMKDNYTIFGIIKKI